MLFDAGRFLLIVLATAVLACNVQSAVASQAIESPYADPRLMKWAKDFISEDYDAVLKSVEADLSQAKPHPFAPNVWISTRRAQGTLVEGWRPGLPQVIQDRLQSFPDIVRLQNNGEWRAAYDLARQVDLSATNDPYLLNFIAIAADDVGDMSLTVAARREMRTRFPEIFWSVWNLEDQRTIRKEVDFVRDALEPRASTLPEVYLNAVQSVARNAYPGAGNQLDMVRQWIAASPNDAMALRYGMLKANDLERVEDILDFARRSFESYPFREYLVSGIGRALVRAGQIDEMRGWIVRRAPASLGIAGDAVAPRVEALVAEALRTAGERGMARDVIEAALKTWPDNLEINRERVELDTADGQPADALPFARKVATSAQAKPQDHINLVFALRRSHKSEEAILFYSSVKPSLPIVSGGMYVEVAAALEELGKVEERLALLEEATAAHPLHERLHRELLRAQSEAGNTDIAYKSALDHLQRFNLPSNQALEQILAVAKADGGDARVEELIADNLDQLGQWKAAWEFRAKRAEGLARGSDQKAKALLDVWRAAANTNASRFWPYEAMLALGEDAKGETARDALWAEIIENLDRMLPGDRGEALLRYVAYKTGKDALQNGASSDATRKELLRALDDYLQLNGDESLFLVQRIETNSAFGQDEGALEDLKRLASVDPDSWYFYSSEAFNLKPTAKVNPHSVLFPALQRLVSRQPSNGRILKEVAERHAKWGGSQLYALALLQRLRNVDAERYAASEPVRGLILGRFGLGAKAYEMQYLGTRSISPGERYIGWFDSARRKAYDEQDEYRTDTESLTVTIHRASGAIEEQTDDGRCGKLLQKKTGATWFRVTYDDNCRLTLFTASDGRSLSLRYDAAGRIEWMDEQSEAMRSEIHLTYDDKDKAKSIEVVGVGAISISYDENGVIAETESSGGRETTVQVLRVFGNLQSFVQQLSNGVIAEDDTPDPELESLLAGPPGDEHQATSAELKIADHLVRNVARRSDYGERAESLLFEILATPSDAEFTPAHREALALLHQLYTSRFPSGLNDARWKKWNEVLARVSRYTSEEAGSAVAALRAAPLTLSQTARWLPRSYLDNPGFWQRIDARDIAGPALGKNLKIRSLLVHSDSSLLVGTDEGLFVRQGGAWSRYVIDDRKRLLRSVEDEESIPASSMVTSMVEADDGATWLGTAEGVVRLDKVSGPIRRWVTSDDGLPSKRVTSLAPAGQGGVFVGTESGLVRLDAGGQAKLVLESEIKVLRPYRRRDAAQSDVLLIVAKEGLFAAHGEQAPKRLSNAPIDDVALNQTDATEPDTIVALRGTQLLAASAADLESTVELRPMTGTQDVLFSKTIFGLGHIKVEDDGDLHDAVAVLTDMGLSVWYDNHFEHKKLPNESSTAPALAMAARDNSAIIQSDRGTVHILERGRVRIEAGSPVYDLISDPELGATFIARGDELQVLFHKDADRSDILTVAYVGVRHLALQPDGHLVFHDGAQILRLPRGGNQPEILFSAKPSNWGEGQEPGYAAVTSILAAKDGSIWVTAGPSLFRFKDNSVDEFNFFKDRARFPLANNMLSRVLETLDGQLWVIGSHEGHIQINGVVMNYGIAALSGDKFELIHQASDTRPTWFITGYTQIDEHRAIFGTTSGFGEHTPQGLSYFESRKDISYQALQSRIPELFLGRRGARLGNDVWLFACAGGIVGYARGSWFLPDRLNWMLPDQYLARYGARTTHAVATDTYGRIYAGTDRGLLVYSSPGSDDIGFLVSNQQFDNAFWPSEQNKLRLQREILFQNIKKSDPRYSVIEEYRELESEIDVLTQRTESEGFERLRPVKQEDDAKQDPAAPPAAQDQLRRALMQKRRDLSNLLARVERDNLALFQILQMRPVDLAALQGQIPPDDVIVQYLPTKDTLYIHLVARDFRNVLQVPVSSDALGEKVRAVWGALKDEAGRLSQRGSVPVPSNLAEVLTTPELVYADLHWLHEKLIDPIRNELEGRRHVYIVPAGQLSYLPFAALVERLEPTPVFLIQNRVIGQMPTLYLLELAAKRRFASSDEALIVADPDGSLPHARVEAERISETISERLQPNVLIGPEATFDAVERDGLRSRIIHLATHAALDNDRPERSYLALAGQRLDLVDIQQMDLRQTDIAFLSACETGIGRDGQEYSTLAHSFAHAGVPSIVASLWAVDDKATSELAKDFYAEYDQDVYEALAKAQRKMIAAKGKSASPAAWAGFVAFGKP